MYRATAVIFSLSIALLLVSCTGASKREGRLGPVTRVLMGDYDKVWRATQKALATYPIRLNNIDTGQIETDVIRGLKVWTPPHAPDAKQPGLRYFLRFSLIKGDIAGKPSVEVNIEKIKTLEKNFFAEEERLPSDGLEEESLLYRIEREMVLERSLDKAFQQNKI